MQIKTADMKMSAVFLYLFKLEIFKFQTVTHIDAPGKQCDGNLRNDSGLIVFDIGVIAPDIHNGTEHILLLLENRPRFRGR